MSSCPWQFVLLARLDEGMCCFAFLAICVVAYAFIYNRGGLQNKKCLSCSHPNEPKAKFCASCGNAFERTGGRKFYRDLLQRITNWKKWGWLEEDEEERLLALHKRDLDVFDGREIITESSKNPESEQPTVKETPAVPKVEESVSTPLGGFEVVESAEETVAPVPAVSPVEVSGVQTAAKRVVKKPSSDPPMKPPRKLSDILQTFMDESNIKIGEFISGLLIIVGSIGLVVTLNVQFRDKVQYLPAAVFMTVVVLFHVAGLYSLHKWNLAASSRVVLYIGSLLIPLNMLAATMRDTLPDNQSWMFYLAVLVGAGGFSSLSFYSSRALMPRRWWPLMLVVLGPTLMQTVIKLLAAGGALNGIVSVNAIILVPLAMVVFAVLAEHRVLRRSSEVTTADAVSLLRVLTLGIFSLGMCVVVLFLKLGDIRSFADVCRYLANPFMILSFVVVSAGMLLHRRMEEESQLSYRLVGTWMAITGCLGAVGAFALAVPDINSMLVVSVLGTVLALTFGRVTRIPFLATTGTIGVGLAGWCLMTKMQSGNAELLTAKELGILWFDGFNSLLLSLAALVCGALHWQVGRSNSEADREFAKYGFLGVVITAGLGLIVAVVCALLKDGQPGTDATVIVFALYAIGTLIAAACLPYKQVIMVASALVPIAWLQATNTTWFASWFNQGWVDKFGIAVFATVVSYVVALIAYWVAAQRNLGVLSKARRSYAQTFLAVASFVAYLVATAFTMSQVYASEGLYQEAFIKSTVLIGVTVVVALCYLTDWTWMFVQIQTIVSVACAVTLAWSLQHPELGLTEGSHVRAQLIALSVGMLFWVAFRKYCQQSPGLRNILVTDLMYADFVLQVIATVVMYFVWLSSLLPAMALIYGADSAVANLSTNFGHTINHWDWILWVVTLGAWISVVPDRHRRASSCCILIVLSGLPILASDRLVHLMAAEAESVAHFLRWGYGLLGVGMALIVCTDGLWWKRLVSGLPRLMDNQDEMSRGSRARQTWSILRVLTLLAAAIPVVAITLLQFVHVAGIYFQGAGGQFDVLAGGVAFFESYPSLTFAGPLWLLMLSTWIYGIRTGRSGYLLLGFPLWQCGWMMCGLMGIWLDSEVTHFGELVHGFNWFLLGLAIYGGAWSGLQRLVCSDPGKLSESTADWKEKLFAIGPPSQFVFGLTVTILAAYGCLAVIDAFFLAGGLPAADWIKRGAAFADLEAFVAVLALSGVIWWWPGGERSTRDKTLVVAVLLTLNALVAHRFVSAIEPGVDPVFVTQVLFNQNLGWSLLFLVALVLIIRQAAASVASSEADVTPGEKRAWVAPWSVSAGQGLPWIAVTNLLTILVGLGTGVLLFSEAHNDWILIGNLGFLAVMYLVLAGVWQEQLSMTWAIVLSLLTVGMIDVQLLDTNVHLMATKTNVALEHFGHLARTEFAALAMVSVVLGLAASWANGWLGKKQEDGSLVLRAGSALIPVSIFLLLVSSVGGVVAEFDGSSSRWIDGTREIANLGIPLVCLALFGRTLVFQYLVRSLYGWGIALFATLLAMWMVNTDQGLAYQLNSLQILYAVTAYLVVWGLIYHFKDHAADALKALGIVQADDRLASNRLAISYCQAVAGIAIVVASVAATFFVNIDLLAHRYLVALLPLAIAYGLQSLKETSLEKDRRPLVAVFCLLPLIGLLWADLGPRYETSVWLSRVVRFFVAASALSALASATFNRVAERWPDWAEVSKKVQLWAVSAAGVSLASTLLLELTGGDLAREMAHLEVAVVCLGLIALAVALLLVALKPDRDPLALTDRGRQIYVYVAELMVLVLAVHLWKSRPEWFGALKDIWPYALFLIAFVGAFASEYLRRSNIAVVSEPIHNTSFLLPAIPILALVLFNDQMQGTVADYKWFFFLAALINVVMAFFRRSFLHAIVSALAGNASLWSVFVGLENFSFVQHPQFWLIPPAVSVLIAGQVNKKHLSQAQLSFLRYATIAVIYLASSSEMVLKWSLTQEGVKALAVLAGLSLLGVGVGMLYHIRQFIYLGLGFFFLSMAGAVAKISSYNQLWFWLALVVFGAVMLVAFAAREKYLPVLKAKLEEMEQWDSSADKEQEAGEQE